MVVHAIEETCQAATLEVSSSGEIIYNWANLATSVSIERLQAERGTGDEN